MDDGDFSLHPIDRRAALKGIGAGLLLIAVIPIRAPAAQAETKAAIRELFGDAKTNTGRITLSLPALAESGNSVPLTVGVDSPMTDDDHVRRVCVFANRNPRPVIAAAIFGPRAGKAQFSTHMRLSGTQEVIAMAEMSDGTLWRVQARVLVTFGACDSLQMRY